MTDTGMVKREKTRSYNSASKRMVFLPFYIALFLLCTQTDQESDVKKLSSLSILQRVNADSIKINWADPNTAADSVAFFRLYYHTGSDSNWQLVNDSILTTSTVVKKSSVAGNDSIFFFAVCAVAKDGQQSKLHASNDTTAFPMEWVLHWK